MSAYQPHDTTDNNVTATQQSSTHHSRNTMDKTPSIGSVNSTETPGKKKFDRKKLITAYILFSADVRVKRYLKSFFSMTMQVRKITMDENPGVKFGEISRIVAERWRGMSDADKQVADLNNLTQDFTSLA